MATKLTEDQIKWILSVESSEAQQEIRKLTKANRELEKANKDRRQEMIKLEMQGKKDTAAYKNLSAEVKRNNTSIQENNTLLKGLQGTMKLSDLTMSQLKKRAQELTRQLDNTSKSLHPEEYNKLEKELGDVRNRMGQLREESKITQQSLGKMIMSRGSIAAFFGNIYTTVATFVVNGIKKIGEFISEGTRMAGMAQGIDFAFNRIANKDYLRSLREQTKGLVSDLTLMKSAVRAENFNIPLSELGKLLEFAQSRARDTGESVDYLVESIINGIGRKSPLILDNLGISVVRLQEEVKKTGDFAGAVGKIIDEEMAKAGPAIDTAADAATRKKVAWENLQLTIGKFFVGFSSGWDNMMAKFAEGLENFLGGSKNMIKNFDDQVNKVNELETNIAPLLNRYDELSKKQNLSKKEQAELNNIIAQVTGVFPGAIAQVDAYGNATAIATGRVRDFIDAEKARLTYMNRDALEQVKKDYNKYIKELTPVAKKIKEIQATGTYKISGTRQTSSFGTSTTYTRDATQEEVKAMIQRNKELTESVRGAGQEMLRLNGTANEIIALGAKNTVETVNNTVDEVKNKIANEIPQWKKDLDALDLQLAQERLKLKEKRANELISEKQYNEELERLEREFLYKKMKIANLDLQTQIQIQDKIFEYKIKMLDKIKKIESDYFIEQRKLIEKQNLERDKQTANLGSKLAKTTDKQLKEEFDRRAQANKQLVELTTVFSTEIGQLVGSAMTGNKDFVKDSIVSLINMGLDYLKIETQLAVTRATLASLAQPDSVATFGASGFARAVVMTGLIEAAFQAAKAVVGGIASKIGGSSAAGTTASGTGSSTRVLSGKESGGFMDVERAQDGRRYRATYAPNRRGYVNRPTVIVGEGVDSKEWIAPNAALENPTIAPFIDLLEQSRLRGDIRTIDLNQIMRARMAGFASGGYLSDNPLADAMCNSPSTVDSSLFITKNGNINSADKSLIELNQTLKKLQSEGVSVNYQEFDKAKKRIENIKSRAARK